jgi:hypothetical protein
MGTTRLREPSAWQRAAMVGVACLGWCASLGSARAAGPSRFASYDTESDCVAAHTMGPAVCRTAFANARSEYEAKTPSFPSQALCTRRFAACMAWPPGIDSGKASFRPRWDGIDIVDTPTERSVTPSPGSTGRAIRFAARPLTEAPRELVIRGAAAPMPPVVRGVAPLNAGRPSLAEPVVGHARGAPPSDRAAPANAPPGSGFTYENGVLTYPAPARFQPKNLPKTD